MCYYKALQIGSASKVVPIDKLSVVITLILAFIFLHEAFTVKSLIGCVLIGGHASYGNVAMDVEPRRILFHRY